jgi:hypothetical protein
MSDYKYTVKLRDKEIKFRKWKVKDKKNFIEGLETSDQDKVEALVYDCIEDKNIGLSEEEFKYILLNIRRESVGKELSFDITCSSCGGEYTYTDDIINIQVPNTKSFGEIKSGNVSIKMGEIANAEYYKDAIKQCKTQAEKAFIDFLYHIKELNGSDAFTFDALYEYVNNLDILIGEDILKQWEEMKFTFDNLQQLECTHCQNKEYVLFDELFGFFPDSWFE